MSDSSSTAPARAARAVLFDLDGTLADTAGDLGAALNRVRADHGLPPVPIETLRIHASSGARGLLGAGMGVVPGDDDFERLRDAFLAHYAACLAETTALFEGVPELLDALEARGIRWGIVTNKAERFTGPVVAALDLHRRTRAIVSGDTTPTPKPHPAPLLHAASTLDVDPSACLYVGDDLRDVLAGNAAGMTSLVARWGYLGDGQDPSSWPAAGAVDAPLDVLDWIATD